MNFSKLLENTDCNCTKNAKEDNESMFSFRIDVSKKLKPSYFKTYHERGKQPLNESCENICSYRGLSMSIWTEESQNAIMEHHRQTIMFSPMLKKSVSILKIKKDGGMFAYTPEQPIYNEFHYDFFKADDFDITLHVDLIKILPLNV